MREVPGTTLLVTGQVGVGYVSLTITDDVVTVIMSGALSTGRTISRRHTRSTTPTIKVSDDLRDRLKERASRDGLTLGAHLTHLADAEDRRRRLADPRVAIAETPEAVRARHADEASAWEGTELTPWS